MAHVFEGLTVRKVDLMASFKRFEDGYPLKRAATAGASPLGIEKWDDEVQGRAGDLRTKFAAVIKQADALHDIEKAPILSAGKAVTGFKNAFLADLNAAVTLIRDRQTIYAAHLENERRLVAEAEARRAHEEADRIAAEAARTMAPEALDKAAEAFGQAALADAEANAPAAALSRVRGQMGSVTSLRTTYKFMPEQSNLMALVRAVASGDAPLAYLQFNETRIGIAVRTEKVRAIPGCVIEEVRSV
jgi:hypothetical protein